MPDIKANVTINGNSDTVQGHGNANNPYRIFTIDPDVSAEIDNLTIKGGFDNTVIGGGGIRNYGSLTLNNDVIWDNTASNGDGGGIKNMSSATLTLVNDLIQFNTAAWNGGGIANGGFLTSSSGSPTTILGNTSISGNGGGISNLGGTVDFSSSGSVQISGNTATKGDGGGIYNSSSSDFTMVGGYISNNSSLLISGGGLYNAGMATLSGVTVEGNGAYNGGGMYLAKTSTTNLNAVTVQNNELFDGNGPPNWGIGIYKQSGAQLNYEGLDDADDPSGLPVSGS